MRLLPRLWLTLLLPVVLLVPSCGTGPKVAVCISDPALGGFDCYDEKTQGAYFVSYANSNRYVALSPPDAQLLLNYCGSSP